MFKIFKYTDLHKKKKRREVICNIYLQRFVNILVILISLGSFII